MLSKHTLAVFLTGAILLAMPPAYCASKDKSSSKSKAGKSSDAASTSVTNSDSEIRAHLTALSSAASNGDVEKMASMWAVDGVYIDADGVQTSGRDAVQRRFSEGQAQGRKAAISLTPTSIKFLGPDAAWSEGTVMRQSSVGMEPSTRFVMVLQKQAGKWYVASATETPIANKNASDHLSAMEWLVGDWSVDGASKVRMHGEWTGNKSFILCKFLIDKPGQPQRTETQIIGWDPTKEQIVSWNFDSNGGFGYGTWTKRGAQWVVTMEGVEQSGSRTNAMNIITLSGPDKFTWQSVNRNIDGVPVADGDALVVQKSLKTSSLTTDRVN
ncbi:MAG: SgcJ/EcaC family oxidoreductase [Candidatus Obscuribacterales bacterium]|nr:SgcJ/EcaC family oxidoreductase [Candidatus Obscuribacterales bacterium]